MEHEGDWVGDSENEDEFAMTTMGHEGRSLSQISMELELQASRAKAIEETSHISTFSTVDAQAGPSKAVSSINPFSSPSKRQDGNDGVSSSISTLTTPSLTRPRPRPRPRPLQAKKKTLSDDDPTVTADSSGRSTFNFLDQIVNTGSREIELPTSSEAPAFDFPDMLSIADRAKTRQRGTTATQAIGHDSTRELGGNGKERILASTKSTLAKPSASKRSKGKAKAAPDPSAEVIELTDDSGDELNLTNKKQKKKAARSSAPNHSPSDQLLPSGPLEQTKPPRPRPRPRAKRLTTTDDKTLSDPPGPPVTDIPSSFPNQPAQNPAIPSSLPPSDFPLTSQPPAGEHLDVPRIETLAATANGSSSSQKDQSDFDELLGDDIDLPPIDPKNGPPPTFFAASSSLPTTAKGVDQREVLSHAERDVVDLTMFPTLPHPEGNLPLADKPKRKKSKKARDDEDGYDPDFDANDHPPKKKKSSKKKTGQVEVVITSRTGSNAITEGHGDDSMRLVQDGKDKKKKKSKSKEKSKETNGKKGNETQEVFKSNEFIEDSDEDPLAQPNSAPSDPAKAPVIPSPLEPAPDPRPPSRPLSPLSDIDMDTDLEPPTRPKAAKKRKSMAIPDDKGDQGNGVSSTAASPSKRQKVTKSSAEKNDNRTKSREVEARLEANEHGRVDHEQSMAPSKVQSKKRKTGVVVSDEEDEGEAWNILTKTPGSKKGADHREPPHPDLSKENIQPLSSPKPSEMSAPVAKPFHRRPSIAPRKSTPMTELIKRVNSLPNSPFPVASSARVPGISRATAYSPYLKSSRTALSKIAPLHPNRRTPPPPPPPPPPKKKTKKELEREEKWEEELIDSLGGIEVWAAMSDMERRDLRKAKFEAEMGGWD
ncbi:hypothetical protein CC1G_06368 [Coprinopsis cinerea okayama7|uniref:Uncharacterized protein n=1 Tax=Coprinopsis cinerea (strain Okayama-7 / 130 / ATCC MYA-4618 / FGSC 9003) TaxID=240176 RepID=A8NTR0_COPC7|nr:hypothetical protein CC1G_06368 [Coprinopsis cinerea okayama7\|eukprot:XP_001836283.1 hypothetical protein CC1G_06368 [Coprinopsis cinerea okayama7\